MTCKPELSLRLLPKRYRHKWCLLQRCIMPQVDVQPLKHQRTAQQGWLRTGPQEQASIGQQAPTSRQAAAAKGTFKRPRPCSPAEVAQADRYSVTRKAMQDMVQSTTDQAFILGG